jgi:hypothetical protein
VGLAERAPRLGLIEVDPFECELQGCRGHGERRIHSIAQQRAGPELREVAEIERVDALHHRPSRIATEPSAPSMRCFKRSKATDTTAAASRAELFASRQSGTPAASASGMAERVEILAGITNSQ